MATQVKSKIDRPPPGKPWNVVINVTLDPNHDAFHFHSDDIEIGPNNEITFENDHQPGFVITFHLEDAHGYRFPEDLKAALSSVDEARCPDLDEGQWGQFKAKAVNNLGEDLVVRNLNETKRKFGYSLFVTNDGGNTFWRLDPIGNNDNGSARSQ